MPIDTNRLVQIAAALKELDQRRERLLSELHHIAGGAGGEAPVALRRGRPPRASRPAMAPRRTKLVVSRKGGRRKKGLTTAILDLLQGNGAAYTAGDIVKELRLSKTKGQIASVSTTLVRLAKEGRVKKDEERGYVAA